MPGSLVGGLLTLPACPEAPVHDIEPFALILLGVGAAVLLALGAGRVSRLSGVPTPALFLVLAALAATLWPQLGRLPIRDDQRIVTVTLLIILFEGGMHIGQRRLRPVLGATLWLGTAGTLVTAAALAALAHGLFDFAWRPALLLGTALAPTDPAVVFSVLGRREITGRSGTLLEGESGANDPVGIALMLSVLGASGAGAGAVAEGIWRFALQMSVGVFVGLLGGWLMGAVVGAWPLPESSLEPIRTLALAVLVYAVATAAHGSGFLAVFVAGILLGDRRGARDRAVRHVTASLAGLAEIVAFVVLGLSVSLRSVFSQSHVLTGLALAALLIVLVRPLLVGAVLLPVRLSRGERCFVLWAGLKGAVPVLLGTFLLAEGVAGAQRIYDVIFVVVTVSVLVQGGLVPFAARALRVPMRLRPRADVTSLP